MAAEAKRLVIIDGKSVFYRGYYAMPNLSTADGTPTGGVFGFAALALEVVRRLKPDYVAVAWDKPKTNIRKRLEIYPDYKAGRKPAPADFYAQIPILHELLEAFGWPLYELDDYEADDIMAALARQAAAEGIEVDLITSDLDALQIVGPLIKVYALKKGLTNIDLYDPEAFTAKYGIDVDQFLDLKSLKGDSSDNIPGVPGIGEKTALSLLQQFQTLDNIYDNLWQIKDSVRKKLEAGRESAYMSKQLAELWFDAPVKLDLAALDVRELDTDKLRQLLTRLEFRSLVQKLPTHMRAIENTEAADASNLPQEIPGGTTLEELARTIEPSEELVLYNPPETDELWLSYRRDKVVKLDFVSAQKLIGTKPVVGHELKDILKRMLAAGTQILPEIKHDVAQGSFLLNSLRKSRSLGDLIGVESIADARHAIAAIWTLYDEQRQALESLPDIYKVATTMDFPLIAVLARMEYRGIKLDVARLDSMSQELTTEINRLEAEIYEMAGYEFNVASPSQLADVLYTKLQLPTAGVKRGKTGYSTGQKELDKLRGQHPIIELIERYRELTKLQNTYVQTLPALVDSKSRLHTTFRQDVASTGRLSSSDPNLQNIPIRSELGRKIREAFVPEPGNVFVNADYSQFELRLAAVMAGEDKMINDFNAGTDIHAKTASEVYGIPLDDVTKEQRRQAKVVNFGILYGMSQHGLAVAAGMSIASAQKFIDEYFRVRPKVKHYIEDIIRRSHEDGFVETLFGRRRWTPDVKSTNFAVRSAAERAAANMPIQGTEADLMKLAMIKIDEKLLAGQDNKPLGEQVLQIHDSIMVECPEANADKVAEILRQTMENIYPELGVNLKVDTSIGKNWSEV